MATATPAIRHSPPMVVVYICIVMFHFHAPGQVTPTSGQLAPVPWPLCGPKQKKQQQQWIAVKRMPARRRLSVVSKMSLKLVSAESIGRRPGERSRLLYWNAVDNFIRPIGWFPHGRLHPPDVKLIAESAFMVDAFKILAPPLLSTEAADRMMERRSSKQTDARSDRSLPLQNQFRLHLHSVGNEARPGITGR